MQPSSALIHTFDASSLPQFDEEGDQLIGCYYQFFDAEDMPISRLIGPYATALLAERACQRALTTKDF